MRLPDLELIDHGGSRRMLTELAGGDPLILHTFRGHWCPKEQRFFRRLCRAAGRARGGLRPARVALSSIRRRSTPRCVAGWARAGRSSPTRTATRPGDPRAARDDRHGARAVRPAGLRLLARPHRAPPSTTATGTGAGRRLHELLARPARGDTAPSGPTTRRPPHDRRPSVARARRRAARRRPRPRPWPSDSTRASPIGWLAAWIQRAKPVRHALRADLRTFDPDGPATTASYVLAGRDAPLRRSRRPARAAARPRQRRVHGPR